MSGLPLRAKLLIFGVGMAALAAFVHTGIEPPEQGLQLYVLLILAASVAAARPVELFYRSTMDVSSGIFLAILTLYGPSPAMLAAAVSKTAAGIAMRRIPVRTWYNASVYVLSLALAGHLLNASQSLGIQVLGVIFAPLAYTVVNIGLVMTAIALSQGIPYRQVWEENFRVLFLPFAALCMLGAMTGYSSQQQGWELGVLLLALVTLYLTFRTGWRLRNVTEEARHLQLLNQLVARLGSPEGPPDLGLMLRGAVDIAGADRGWLIEQGQLRRLAGPDLPGEEGLPADILAASCHSRRGQAEPAGDPLFANLGSSSLVCIPLSVQGELVACLNLHVPQRASAERLGPVVTSLGHQASSALERAQLHQRELLRTQALESLMVTIREINTRLSLDSLLALITREAVKNFRTEAAVIFLAEPDGSYAIRSSVGLSKEYVVQQRLFGERVRHAFPSPQAEPQALILDLTETALGRLEFNRREGLRTGLYLPLWTEEKVAGVLGVISKGTVRAFSQSEIELVQSLASQAAITLRNISLYVALEDKEQRLRHFLDRLVRAQEEERKFISYDIHDGLLQYVIAADMHLKSFEATVPQGLSQAGDLTRGLDLLQSAISEGRRIISDLRPSTLDDFGLVDTLQHHLARLEEQMSWQVSFEEHLNGRSLPPSVETTIFRIIQEALNNAQKHAQSERVAVSLDGTNGEVRIRVQDWGQGFDLQAITRKSRGLGLSAIQERASLMGGWCNIESQPGQGTTIYVGIPIPEEGSQDEPR